MTPPDSPLLVALLQLPAALYRTVIAARNAYYDRPSSRLRAGLPVISVGNLTTGGTGKTPLVAHLAERLRSLEVKPAVVSRGYGGRAGRGPLVVSVGEGPLCTAEVCGDEPFMLASRLSGVPVIVGSDRHAAAVAAREQGAGVVLLDDGFQHRRLDRDLDIVLLDSSVAAPPRHLIPAGTLREPWSSLGRADVVLLTRSRSNAPHDELERRVRRHNRDAPVLRAGHRAVGFFDTAGAPAPTPTRAIAFCGIGNPARFRADLETAGVDVVEFRPRRDHHVYSAAELRTLHELASTHEAELVTTEKDRARLGAMLDGPDAIPLRVFRIEAEVFEPRPLETRLRSAIEGRPPC